MQVSTATRSPAIKPALSAVILGVEAVQKPGNTYTILEVQSQTSNKVYRVDVTNKRCSCPAWTFQKRSVEGRSLCKHLKSLGFTELVDQAKSNNAAVVIDGITLL